jgi:hypothetical protein
MSKPSSGFSHGGAKSPASLMGVLLFGAFLLWLLSSLMRWPSRTTPVATVTTVATTVATAAPVAAVPAAAPLPTAVAVAPGQTNISGTHQVLCEAGKQGLNLRPQPGLVAPILVIPCGAILTVTGADAVADSETWSPVVYQNQGGWSASRLLRRIQ